LIESCSIVVAATDDLRVQGRINRIAYNKGKLVLFPGVFDKGEAGEIVIVNPSLNSPCYHCITSRVPINLRNRVEDYGTNRLEAVAALNAEIMTIVSTTTRIILGFLSLQDLSSPTNNQLVCFSRGINEMAYFLLRMSFYPVPWYKELKMIGIKTKNEIPRATYSFSTHWFSAESMQNLNHHRSICDICGPIRTPLNEYPFIPFTWEEINETNKKS